MHKIYFLFRSALILLLGALLLVTNLGGAIPFAEVAAASDPVPADYPQYANDYPYRNDPLVSCSGGGPCAGDMWQFYQRECTSYVAWRINFELQRKGSAIIFKNNQDNQGGNDWASAFNWAKAAEKLGYKVDNTPKKGSIAFWEVGHVAYVEWVNPDGTVDISEYNFDSNGDYNVQRNKRADKYIHFHDDIIGVEPITYSRMRAADFNGDGKDDVARSWNKHIQVFLSDGAKFGVGKDWIELNPGPEKFFYTGDFNGDGKSDIARSWNKYIQVFLSNGSKFTFAGEWANIVPGPEKFFYVGDFNGDGKDDLARSWDKQIQVFLSNGTKFNYAGDWLAGAPGKEGFFYIGDFNGDNKDDVARSWNKDIQVYLAGNNKFTLAGSWINLNPGPEAFFYVGDFNGDGASDIARSWNKNLQVFASNKTNKFTHVGDWLNAVPGPERFFYVGDYNGDGADDIKRSWNRYQQVFTSNKTSKFNYVGDWLFANPGPEGFFY